MTGGALVLGGARALAQTNAPAGIHDATVVRVYSTADGGSRVEELAISPDAKPSSFALRSVHWASASDWPSTDKRRGNDGRLTPAT